MLFDGHNAYITTSYAAAFITIGGLTVRIMLNAVATQRRLAELEALADAPKTDGDNAA